MNQSVPAAAFRFRTDGTPTEAERYGCGHINVTWRVITDTGRRYILQKLSPAFPAEKLMHNIQAVTDYLCAHTDDPRGAMRLIRTTDGTSYHTDETGSYRMYDYVENGLCLQCAEQPEDFYESAVAFGTFQRKLADFPASTLTEPIPNFHNTPDRYRIFHETIARNPVGRVDAVQKEIAFALEREAEAGTLQELRESGALPLRVTHNDTKLNNVILDAETRKALCVVDLDTVMPGLSAYDFGDAIRFGAATAAEDERDLSLVRIDLNLFRTFTRGYLNACALTEREIDVLPIGAKLMTLECGVRFLTDHLDGDHYFSIHREGHNLDRARTQFKMVAEMEAHWDEMRRIVREEAGRC